MKVSIILLMAVARIWSLPSNIEKRDGHIRKEAVIVVGDASNTEIQIAETEGGKLKLEVFQRKGTERIQIPTKVWKVPEDWKAPGRKTSRVVHAELLSNGDVVLVLYNQQHGLELIVLPLEIVEVPERLSTASPRPILFPGQNPIIFPNFTVPWHPTVPTPQEKWEWASNPEDITPSYKVLPVPEKVSLPAH